MADIVLGIGSSHGPTMHTTPDDWLRNGREDETDPRFDFAALRATTGDRFATDLNPAILQRRYDQCQAAVAEVQRILRESRPDVVILLSNPHGGVAQDRMQPTFGIFLSDPPPVTTRRKPATSAQVMSAEEAGCQVDGELARHLMNALIADGFDVACSFQSQPGANLDEAFTLLQRMYDPDRAIAYVPFAISRYLPNQATPQRCFALGEALRRAIHAWSESRRVAIMASGGLSHQVIDEELDRQVIAALTEADVAGLTSISRERLNRAPGTPEILNWVACAGAMHPLPMALVDYIPCYRSLAGTGQGVTFGYWQP